MSQTHSFVEGWEKEPGNMSVWAGVGIVDT